MYLSKIKLTNIRSIDDLEITFDEGKEPGWHVILGDNGSGKSTVIRSIALGLVGSDARIALRQTWDKWLQRGVNVGNISLFYSENSDDYKIYINTLSIERVFKEYLVDDKNIKVPFGFSHYESVSKSLDIFTSSFGTSRRFSKGNKESEEIWNSLPGIANHLSAFGEETSLSSGLQWLQKIHIQTLEDEYKKNGVFDVLNKTIKFINTTNLFPNGETIAAVSSDDVHLKDAYGKLIPIQDMSDGFCSISSLLLELLSQMYKFFGVEKYLDYLNVENGTIDAPAIVSIDEVDAHLHPNWQKEIGVWFTKHFPKTQFIVTTHSPIVCRAAADGGSIWRLPAPGTGEKAYRVEGDELNRLLYGNILDAYSTGVFGDDITRSELGKEKLERLAKLNMRSIRGKATEDEQKELGLLRAMLPSSAPILKTESSTSDVEAAE